MKTEITQDIVNFINDIRHNETMENKRRDLLNAYGNSPFMQSLAYGDYEKCCGDIYRGRVNAENVTSALRDALKLGCIDEFKYDRINKSLELYLNDGLYSTHISCQINRRLPFIY